MPSWNEDDEWLEVQIFRLSFFFFSWSWQNWRKKGDKWKLQLLTIIQNFWGPNFLQIWMFVQCKCQTCIGTGTQVMPSSYLQLKKLRLCPICLINFCCCCHSNCESLRCAECIYFANSCRHIPVHLGLEKPCNSLLQWLFF